MIRAVPFDATRVAVTGPSIPMESGVYVHRLSGAAEFDVSTSGTLAYISAQQELRALVWVDRAGNDTAIPADAGFYTYPRLSPDDLRLSVGVRTSEQDILTWEFARPGLRPLVRNTAAVGDVLWVKDGTIMYAVTRDGKTGIYRQKADGTGQAVLVVTSDRPLQPLAIVPDGSALVVRQRNEIGVVSLSGSARIESLVSGVSNATLSPNGAWLAYESEDRQVIVKPFPRTNEGSWTISSGAGLAPLFSRDGRELFYLAPGKMMSARVIEGRTFSTAAPEELFSTGDYVIPGIGRTFDVAADGRFLMMKPVGRPDPEIRIVFNWFDEVAARVKAR